MAIPSFKAKHGMLLGVQHVLKSFFVLALSGDVNSQARVAVAWMGSFLENLCRDDQYQHLGLVRDCVFLGLIYA